MDNLYKKMFKSSLNPDNTNDKEKENSINIDKRFAEEETSPEKELSLSLSNEKKEGLRANKIFILHENLRLRAERLIQY